MLIFTYLPNLTWYLLTISVYSITRLYFKMYNEFYDIPDYKWQLLIKMQINLFNSFLILLHTYIGIRYYCIIIC